MQRTWFFAAVVWLLLAGGCVVSYEEPYPWGPAYGTPYGYRTYYYWSSSPWFWSYYGWPYYRPYYGFPAYRPYYPYRPYSYRPYYQPAYRPGFHPGAGPVYGPPRPGPRPPSWGGPPQRYGVPAGPPPAFGRPPGYGR